MTAKAFLPVTGGRSMTSEEKKKITQLRRRGCTYQEITRETGLALSTVKMHFQRMKPIPNIGTA